MSYDFVLCVHTIGKPKLERILGERGFAELRLPAHAPAINGGERNYIQDLHHLGDYGDGIVRITSTMQPQEQKYFIPLEERTRAIDSIRNEDFKDLLRQMIPKKGYIYCIPDLYTIMKTCPYMQRILPSVDWDMVAFSKGKSLYGTYLETHIAEGSRGEGRKASWMYDLADAIADIHDGIVKVGSLQAPELEREKRKKFTLL